MILIKPLEKIINFQLSRKAKEAIKVALAFSITYLIALKVGWLSPFWAAFTVGQVALFPNAQSLHKGALRLTALIPAILVATLIFAFAIQDRWLFVSMACSWVILATYLMIKDQKRDYMWNVAGFVALIFLVTPFTSTTDLFDQMASRLLDAALGISIYTLVTVFIWPDSNIWMLKKTCINLTAIQTKIFTLMASQNNSLEDKTSIRQAGKQEILLLNRLKLAFFAKGSETPKVQEAAEFWKEFYSLSHQLGESFSRLNNSFLGLENIDIYRLIPELDRYRETIIERFKLAGDILENGNREFKTETIRLSIDEAYLTSLSPFDQLAFTSSRNEFAKTEELSQKILRCANNIMDESVDKKEISDKVSPSIYERLAPDIDLLKSLFFMGSLTFCMFCVWIYFDPPGHMKWFYLAPTIAFVVAATPQMKTSAMILPSIFILLFVILFVYSLILPRLSGTVELGSFLFICMFIVFYFLEGIPRLIAVIGIATKLTLTNVNQTYDFANAANMWIWSVSAYVVIYVYSYMLDSPRPQKAVLKRIRRYYKSAQFLASKIASEKNINQKGIWIKFQIAFYRYELKTLPLKIRSWSAAIDHKHFPENSPEAIEDLLVSIHILSNSFDEWFQSNSLPQKPLMFNATIEELDKWRGGIETIFRNYKNNFDSSLSNRIRNALNQHISNLEDIINRHEKEIADLNISEQEKENLFRLVGSYQGLSHSLIAYASVAELINWKHWEEEVFA